MGMDPYSYVGGNPETETDPTGMWMIAPNGDTSWINPNGVQYMYTPATGPTVLIPPVISLLPPPRPRVVGAGATLAQGYSPDSSRKPFVGSGHHQLPPSSQSSTNNSSSSYNTCGQPAGTPQTACMPYYVIALLDTPEGTLPAVTPMCPPSVCGGHDPLEHVEEEEGFGTGGTLKSEEPTDGTTDPEADTDGACGGGLSFASSTLVATSHGEQTIGTLHPSERVWAYNPRTHKKELQPILHVWINHDNDLVDLTITHVVHTQHGKAVKPRSEVIHTNKKHPFLTVEKGFLPVGKIKLGMHVVEADGQIGVISGWKLVAGTQTMYNLEVTQDHTFAVGTGQWVVHNCDVPDNIDQVWHEGTYDTPSDSALAHYNKHGEEVGAQDFAQYIRKALGFRQNLRGASKWSVAGATEVIRYAKLGKYIDIASDGRIVSFGAR